MSSQTATSSQSSTPITIYVDWSSQPCRAIRRICDLNNVPEGSIVWSEISLLKGDHFQPSFLALNPNHTVPVMVHNGLTMFESTAIVEYLDEVVGLGGSYGLPSRVGQNGLPDNVERFQAINALTNYHNAIRPATKSIIVPVFPVLFDQSQPPLRLDLKEFQAGINTAVETVFKPLEQLLVTNKGFISPSGKPTAADVFAFVELWQFVKWDLADDNFDTFQVFDFDPTVFPALRAWLVKLHQVVYKEDLWAIARGFVQMFRTRVPEMALLNGRNGTCQGNSQQPHSQ